MNFDWSKFTEAEYKKLFEEEDYIGAAYIGDICIEFVVETVSYYTNDNWNTDEIVEVNFYVAHEDTGYGYKDYVLPYDYADGFDIGRPYGLSYDEFKEKIERMSVEYIEAYKGDYSLVEHANRPLEIW